MLTPNSMVSSFTLNVMFVLTSAPEMKVDSVNLRSIRTFPLPN